MRRFHRRHTHELTRIHSTASGTITKCDYSTIYSKNEQTSSFISLLRHIYAQEVFNSVAYNIWLYYLNIHDPEKICGVVQRIARV